MRSTKKSTAPGTAVFHQQGRPIKILYGSDTGTCEALAKHFTSEAATRGFTPSISTMNMAVRELPQGRKYDWFTLSLLLENFSSIFGILNRILT